MSLANSLTASGSGKHQSDVDHHVVHDEYGISNVSGLVGDNASTQKGTTNGLIANNSRAFGKEMFLCWMLPPHPKHYVKKDVSGWVWG